MTRFVDLRGDALERLEILREEYTCIGLSTEPADLEACREAFTVIYAAARWPVPSITLVSSPADFGRRQFDRHFSQIYILSWQQIKEILISELAEQVVAGDLMSNIDSKLRKWLERSFRALREEISREFGPAEKGMVSFAGSCEVGWISTYRFLVELGLRANPQHARLGGAFDLLCRSCLWWWPLDRTVVVLDRPAEMHLTRREDTGEWLLHNSTGPVLVFRDGTSGDPTMVFALNNVVVPPWLVLTSPARLKAGDILGLENAEQRREGVRRIGVERLIQELGARVLDRQGDYELLSLEVPQERGAERRRPYLKMRNPSLLGVWHVEGVHPNCRTVKEALRWRNRTDAQPKILT